MSEKKEHSLVRSGLVVSAMTMISRVLGLVRDIVLARLIGDSPAADAFYVAFKVPNFLRRLFAEGAFSQAFVPVLSEYREQGSLAVVHVFINRMFALLGVSVISLSVFVVIFSPQVTMLVAYGFSDDPQRFGLTADFLRITFPYLALISLTGFAGSILNSYDRFAVPAITPLFLNLSLICSGLFMAPLFSEPAYALAWGVLIAGFVQLAFQIPFLARINLLPRPELKRDKGVSKVLKLMIPALFGVSVGQINLLLDTLIASFLPAGSVSWLYYSDRLAELPLGVFAIALATVVLPSLSRTHVRGAGELFSNTLKWASSMVFVIGLPAMLALCVLAEPLLFTLFGYGALSDEGIVKSAVSLQAYALGLLAFMWIKVLATGFYSRQDTKTPVKIGLVAMASNMLFNLIFVYILYDRGLGHAGLALATAASAWLNAGLLWFNLKRDGVWLPGRIQWHSFMPLFASLAMVAGLVAIERSLAIDWMAAGLSDRLYGVTLLVLAGVLTYAVSLVVCGWRKKHLIAPK